MPKYLKLAFWGPIVGLIGGIVGIVGGTFGLVERFSPPGVEIVEALPVYVWAQGETTANGYSYKKMDRGFSIIVRLRSKGRSVLISGLEISGKQHMTFDEWFGITEVSKLGDKQGSFSAEYMSQLEPVYFAKKPYYRVSWTGWIEDSRVPVKLEAHEERYIRFTVVEPTSATAGRIMSEKYLGYDDDTRNPEVTQDHAEAWDFFERGTSTTGYGWEPIKICNDIENGSIKLYLRAGATSIRIPHDKLKPFKKIRLEVWNDPKKDVHKLFHDRYY